MAKAQSFESLKLMQLKYRGTLHKPSPLGSKENDEITGVTTYWFPYCVTKMIYNIGCMIELVFGGKKTTSTFVKFQTCG